ncbi:hypothetical protein GJ496_007301 [Pomphorhynchus laevis]|nr:hypothetical protein GJ496_007301 [Pomphorhynchus laevis]
MIKSFNDEQKIVEDINLIPTSKTTTMNSIEFNIQQDATHNSQLKENQTDIASTNLSDNEGPSYLTFKALDSRMSATYFSDDDDFPESEDNHLRNNIANTSTESVQELSTIDTTVDPKPVNKRKKIKRNVIVTLRLLSLLPILYFFVCSLDLLTSGFQLLAGKTAGNLFAQNTILQNPIAGLMIGVLVTVLVQSSSTTTSIIVSMVSAGIIPVKYSIPMIMGANVGTSTTNTLVSLGQMDVVDEFKRAFAGATVHDAFNWMNVIVQLPLEVGTGFLYKLTTKLVENINSTSNTGEPQFLNVITKPLTKSIIQINWTVVENIANNISLPDNATLRKLWCKEIISVNETTNESYTTLIPCNYLLIHLNWPDWGIGLLLTIVSLALLMICLMLMVRNLRYLLEGKISKILRKTIDKDFPGIFKYLTPYFFILIGIGLTIIVQSSSVFTSTLTPLVGSGVISLKRMYPLTLGSNVGTTITAIISAMAAPTVPKLQNSLQAALCHLFFNIFGIIIFFVIIPMRNLPIETAKFFGRETAKYRWFAILYLVLAFIIVPGILLGISFAGNAYSISALVIMIVGIITIVTINYLMKHKPKYLPNCMRSWTWLPEPLRSLAPYDRVLMKFKLFSSSFIRSKVIRPDTSVTSMTHLFKHRDKNMSSNTIC